MKIKIAVCLALFLFLFSGAWVLQQKNQREFFYDKTEYQIHNMNVEPLNTTQLDSQLKMQGANVQKKLYLPFKSREYVRISGF